ncbi:MAG: hypothetical protein N3A72_00435 [bacterium]|nr:hypothetical protein [bacterium]
MGLGTSRRVLFFWYSLLLVILISSGYAAKTVIGYVNGEKLLMGVAYNNKWGSLMITTNNANCDWDNLSEPYHSYSEDWQTHPAGFPADWRVGGGSGSVYNVVTGTDNVLRAMAYDGFGRILYGASASDTTWQTPIDFSATAKNIQLQYESTPEAGFSILRIGFGGQGGTNDFGQPIQVSGTGLYAYQFYNSTRISVATGEWVKGVPNMISIRDGQNIPLHAISYSGFTSGATLTFRLVVRNPIPIEFCDANKDSLTTIPSSGAYIKVEALNPFSFNSAIRDTTQVTLWTTSGDTETILVTELFDAQTTVGTLFNCNNNVFISDTPISVSTSLSVVPAFIKMNPGQSTTFLASGNPIGINNNRIDGFGQITAYVAYSGATASASVICGGAAPFTWQSSDTTIGYIDSTTGVFLAQGVGTVTITATDANGFTGSATVQILTTDAPIAPEGSAGYRARNELFEVSF